MHLTKTKELFTELNVAPSSQIKGCSKDEVKKLEEKFNVTLPEAYKEFLLWMGKKYKYESKTFIIKLPNGVKSTYTPDFLINMEEWHEIKGWKDRSKIRKWELFQQQYPKEKFILIDKDKYKDIEKLYKYIVPNWEF